MSGPRLAFPRVSVAGRPPVEFCVDLDAPDEVAPWLLEHDWIDEPVQHAFLAYVRAGTRALDLGSHLGVFALPAAALGAEVLAVDASPRHAFALKTAAARASLDTLTVIHGAITDAAGPVGFVEDSIHGHLLSSHPADRDRDYIEVESVTVDGLLEQLAWPSLDVVKMDIEGAEPAALVGMSRLFARGWRPVIVFECNGVMLPIYGSTVRGLRQAFTTLGYEIYQIDHLRPGALVASAPDALQPEAASDYLALPRSGPGPPDGWRVEPPYGADQLVSRLIDQGCSPAWETRRYIAELIADAPPWLRTHAHVSAAVAALEHDQDARVSAALARAPAGLADAPEPLPGERGDDLLVWASDVSLAAPAVGLERAPGRSRPAVRGLSLYARRGQALAVVGSEPTTALVMAALAGVTPVVCGELAVSGRVIELGDIAAGLEPGLTVAENIIVFAAYLGCHVGEVSEQVAPIARRAGARRQLERPLGAVARAVARRICAVIALEYSHPDLLLLHGALDFDSPRFAAWVVRRVSKLRRSGAAVIQAVSDPAQLLFAADRMLWIRSGRPVACGHADSVAALRAEGRSRRPLGDRAPASARMSG